MFRFAEKNNLPKLEYVSLPRAGAMKIIMEEVGPHIDQGASTSKQANKKGKMYICFNFISYFILYVS